MSTTKDSQSRKDADIYNPFVGEPGGYTLPKLDQLLEIKNDGYLESVFEANFKSPIHCG